jgi:hypothetical protein
MAPPRMISRIRKIGLGKQDPALPVVKIRSLPLSSAAFANLSRALPAPAFQAPPR